MLLFFLLTFAVSWSSFVAATRMTGAWQSIVLFVGTIAPALVALGLMAREQGRAGLATFFRRRFTWADSPKWYVFAIGFFLAIKLTAALLHRAFAGVWPRFGTESFVIIAVAIVISTPVQAGEEIGWRGYALPRMASRFGLRQSSIMLGVIWSVWHLPLFYLPGADKMGQSFPVYLLGTTTLSIAMTWLFANTNGSLLMTMLMHSAVNQTTGIVPSSVESAHDAFALSQSLVAWLTVALMTACAAYFLARMPKHEAVGPDVFFSNLNSSHTSPDSDS